MRRGLSLAWSRKGWWRGMLAWGGPVLLGMAALVLGACAEDVRTRSDVILVTLDATRVDHLSTYGYPRPTAPALDKLARDSVAYERAWTTAPWTLPSHASMMTGKHPTSHGAHHEVEHGEVTMGPVFQGDLEIVYRVNRLAEREITLAELLRDQGYATAAFVGGPWLASDFGLLQGYHVQDAVINPKETPSAADLTNRAISWLETVSRESPVHLFVNYFDPHHPYEPPPEFDLFSERASDRGQDVLGFFLSEERYFRGLTALYVGPYMLMICFTASMTRYRLPLMIFAVLFASGLFSGQADLSGSFGRRRKLIVPGAVLAVLIFLWSMRIPEVVGAAW